ncbi:unnamed protein product [Schistocephalus solidus]|uniref:RalBP1-associated Eps domain-containing protein 2 n=1 Tax=Schistocephalus solidus TaxID=70667 RepID=A0A183TAI7_SCHSO|nr:unnamed protein product [Schistocephalus solidus]
MKSSSVPRPEVTDLWAIAPDQKAYYLSQFLRLQPDPSGHLSGLQAKAFFELSKLPIHDLSTIWELSDVDCDGKLTLSEFCVAMHLVVLRRNNVLLPKQLPQTLQREATSNALSAVNLPRRSSPDQPAPPSPPGYYYYQIYLLNHNGPESVLEPPRVVPRLVLSEHHSLDSAPPTGLDCPDSDSLAVRQRRWSASSQSDVVSLTENAVPSFDGRLAPNAQLHHPIPIRAGAALASFHSPPSIRRFNAVQPLNLPSRTLTGVPSNSAVSATAIFEHAAPPPAPPPPPQPAPPPRPPTPPPRARTIGATGGRPFIGPAMVGSCERISPHPPEQVLSKLATNYHLGFAHTALQPRAAFDTRVFFTRRNKNPQDHHSCHNKLVSGVNKKWMVSRGAADKRHGDRTSNHLLEELMTDVF